MAGNAARFTKRYTQAQKDAILHAVLIDAHTVAEAVRMAHTGQLNLPAFEVSRFYAYSIVKNGREAFEAQNETALAASTRAELKRLHALNLKKARAISDESDPAEIARVAKALAETQRTLGAEAKTKAKAAPTRSENGHEEPNGDANTKPNPDVLTDLLARAPKNTPKDQRTGSISRAPKP